MALLLTNPKFSSAICDKQKAFFVKLCPSFPTVSDTHKLIGCPQEICTYECYFFMPFFVTCKYIYYSVLVTFRSISPFLSDDRETFCKSEVLFLDLLQTGIF